MADQLKSAREAAGMTPERVAEVTKMKSDQVRALERGDYDAFPARVFVRGFVKSYAALLKLDTDVILEDLRAELGESGPSDGVGVENGAGKGSVDQFFDKLSRVKWSVALPIVATLILLFVSAAVMRAVDNYHSLDPVKGLGSGLYEPPSAPGSDEYLPLPPPQSAN